MSAAVQRFGEIAAKLADNGYQPVPVHFGRKNPCPDGWQHYELSEHDLKRYADAGVGLLCGRVIGLDIDVRDPKLAEEIEALAERTFGLSPRRIGQPPKVLRLLQAEAPFAKIATRGYRLPEDGPEDKHHRVETLARGQQLVAYNLHPDTGQPYVWNGAGDPLTVPIGMLPVVSEADARLFIATADSILARTGKPVGKLVEADDRRTHETNEELQAADTATLRQALASIPNADLEWDDWARVMLAVKGALGESGLKDFLVWSAKSTKDVPTFSTREYLAAKPTRIGAGSIYYLAARHGWKRPAQEAQWGDPINILSELAAPAFSAECLPDELSRFPVLYARATGFDPSITLTAAVSAAAAALSDDFRLCADSGAHWFESARLWLLTIAHPGAGKTPGQREMARPLRELHTELVREFEKALTEWKRVAQQSEDPSEAGPQPPRPSVILDDTTIERLVDVLIDNPRGVLVVAEEFDSWLGSLDQYRSGEIARDRGQWLAAFDGGPHTVERVKRGSMFVPNWSAGILTATTPAALAKLTRHLPIDGLIQRFVTVIARRKQFPNDRPDRDKLEHERAGYRETIRRLWTARPRAHNGVVPLSPDARLRLDAWLQETQLLQEGLGTIEPALEAHIAKQPAMALRVALTFHCARIVNHEHPEARDPAAFPIPLSTLETALRFMHRATQHAITLYLSRKGGSHAYELAQAIARFVLARSSEENTRGLHRRDLLRRVSLYREADERVQSRAMDMLIDSGWLRQAAGGYQKTTATRYAVNPAIATKYAKLADQERDRRALVRERIAEAAKERREQDANG